MVGTRNLWKNIVVLCVNSLTGYGIHHCFARRMIRQETQETTWFHNFYVHYYTTVVIAVASCIALCPAVGLMGRRGGLLMFMIITALASLLELGLLNLLWKYSDHLNIDSSDTLNDKFSIAFSIIGMFSSHAVSNLSIFFCAEITPTVIRGGGVGLVLASAGFGMLTEPIMELHNQKGYFLHHIIFACCTLICIICILLLPETRYQPLPETLADGENYTRQPLLPPRKPGEKRLLLPQSDSTRDYTRVHDTPLHEAANVAASTMESTASSAVDLTAPMAGEVSVPIHVKEQYLEPEDPNGHTVSSPSPASVTTPSTDDFIPVKKEHILSSSPIHKPPCITDPLLADAEDLPAVLDSAEPQMDCKPLEINDVVPSPTSENNSGPAASLDSSSPLFPRTAPASLVICTTPILEPPPSSTLESPDLQDHDAVVTKSHSTPMEDANIPDSPSPPLHDSLPPSPVPSPVPVTDSNIPAPTTIPQTDSPPPLGDSDDSSNRDSHPPHLDLASTSDNDSPPHPSPPPCLGDDSARLTPPPPVDSVNMPSADSSTPTASLPVLPVTDIVQTSTPESTSLNVTDIMPDSAVSLGLDSTSNADSGPTEAALASLIDCTVSSPIDSGFLAVRDEEAVSTENNTVSSTEST